jgi:hypothetical protein
MANYKQLNANDPNQVRSAQKLSIPTTELNTWLFIFSGIAMQEQYADNDFWGSTQVTDANVDVTLDNISGELLAFASGASQAITYVSGTIADLDVWDTTVTLRANGDLILSASTSVAGPAGFAGFSYYVSVKMLIDVATISGTIRWRKPIAAPLSPPHFQITAQSVSGPIEATGAEAALDSADPAFFRVPYVISGALLGKTVEVFVEPISASFDIGGAPGFLATIQISGPTTISLTTANRHINNINFEMELEPPIG